MVKITALPSETTPTGDDVIAIVDNAGAVTKKVTVDNLATGFSTGAIAGAKLATSGVSTTKIADGAVTTPKMTATTWSTALSGISITTSSQNVGTVTLPTVTAAHKYLIIASFVFNHEGGGAARDYFGDIRVSTTQLRGVIWSAAAGSYLNTLTTNTIFTSSATGWQTINFTVNRNSDNGGTHNDAAHYSIIDLGRA